MPTSTHLGIEKVIANAHRQLTFARDLSSTLRDLGLHDDLQMVLIEIERLQVDLLRSGTGRRMRKPLHPVSQTERD